MAGTSELIDFRRAFVWLLCGMLLPSVALIAFGVVAVVNERVAVERRLETAYGARLQTLDTDLQKRLQAAADAAAGEVLGRVLGPAAAPSVARAIPPGGDPLLAGEVPAAALAADAGLADAVRRAQTLPPGERLLVASDAAGDRRLFVLVRIAGPA